MIVHMIDDVEAYGVYPGGQNGNPGSAFYDNSVDTWAQGKYNRLWFMRPEQRGDKRIKARLNFSKI